MGTLAGQAIKDKYGNLLQVEGGITSTLKTVEDGTGNTSALSISTDAVEISGMSFSAAPASSSTEATALFIDANNNVVTRELGGAAFGSAAGVFEETFVGTTTSAFALANSGDNEIVIFSTPDNTVDSTSFHFGNSPAKLELDQAAREYIENISGASVPVYVDMSATVEVTSPNSNIVYTLEKWNGSAWNTVKTATRYKSSAGSQIDSFWGIFMVGDGERLRIKVSTTTGGVSLSTSSQFRFTVKETGNIL